MSHLLDIGDTMVKKTLSAEKMWEVKPGTKVITIPQWIHSEHEVTTIDINYKTKNGQVKKEVNPDESEEDRRELPRISA